MSGILTCLVVLYDEPDSSCFQLGEEYLAGMLYERDGQLQRPRHIGDDLEVTLCSKKQNKAFSSVEDPDTLGLASFWRIRIQGLPIPDPDPYPFRPHFDTFPSTTSTGTYLLVPYDVDEKDKTM